MLQNTSKSPRDLEFLLLQYQILANQQLNHNSLVWSTPSLLFVAQAFLWDASLNNSIDLKIRCLLSFASILIGFASLHGFIRNRLMEIVDCEQLRAIEAIIVEQNYTQGDTPVMSIHNTLLKRTIICNKRYYKMSDLLKGNSFYKTHPLSHVRTYFVWEIALWAFFILSIILFIHNLNSATSFLRDVFYE